MQRMTETNPTDYEGILKSFDLADDRLWHYRATICRVIDGDTVVALVDKGFKNFQLEHLRLWGIDTPELRPRKGTDEEKIAEKVAAKAAKARVEQMIGGKEVIIRTKKADKYGRYLAEIFLPDDLSNTVNDQLVEEGYAVEYMRKR